MMTGKRTATGNNRPFSLKATKRTFRPNLFWKRVFNPFTGRWERMKLSARAIKTLKKWDKERREALGIEVEAKAPKTTGETGKHVKKEKLTPKQKKELAAAKEAEAKAAAAEAAAAEAPAEEAPAEE